MRYILAQVLDYPEHILHTDNEFQSQIFGKVFDMSKLSKASAYLRWNRKIHLWVGLYMVAITLIWLLELLVLPYFYSPRAFPLPQKTLAALIPDFESRQADGQKDILGKSTAATLNYDFASQKYIITANDGISYMTIDGDTKEIAGPFIDHSMLFSKYSALGWLHPRIQQLFRFPFELSFIILSITGFIIYWKDKKKIRSLNKILHEDTPYIFTRIPDENIKIRFASLGIYHGTLVRIVRLPRRGPLILEIRNSHIAFGGKVAEILKTSLAPIGEETTAAS